MNSLLTRFCLVVTLLIFQSIFAQTTTSAAMVKGNCGMCKERIENAAKAAGATKAEWNAAQQDLSFEYDAAKTSRENILKKIAEAGHDNALYSADDAVYQGLPGCCHYTRTSPAPNKEKNEFFVRGNCSSCKARIEKAAKEAGAKTAIWDAGTQSVILDFDPAKTNADAILKKIAAVGHDNEKYRAEDSVYQKLPACCLYNREIPFGEKNPEVHHDSEKPTTTTSISNSTSEKTSDIQGVTLIKTADATALNRKEASLTFDINKKELLKAACCNLSESFETNATVDVSFSNAVTGTKQLKMLGLDQKYTALTKELLPEIRGLASAYGLSFIPGRWIGGIQLTKGGSTVTNGYESITGQINTELLKYQGQPETTFNFYADQNARMETNITSVSALSDHWNQSLLIHANGTFSKMDYNKDGFLDQPLGNQLNVAYLLNYSDLEHSGWGSHFGLNVLKDTRTAGQKNYDRKLDQSEQTAYGVGIDISRLQVWNKTGYIFKDAPYRSLGLMNQFTYHQQNSFFGFRNYDGQQHTFYSNLIYEDILGNTNHKYKTGLSFLYDQYDENYLTQDFRRTETVPGIFAEYTLTGLKYTLVAGARADFHNLAGTQFSPRINFKYDFTPTTVLRLSAGRGFRTANLFAENQQYFASNRQIEIQANDGKIYGLKPEIAWNYGVSLQQNFNFLGRKSTLIADFFRTDFQNQVITDLDESARKIVFYNLDGRSFANSFQTQWDLFLAKDLELRMAYKYYDVATQYHSGLKKVPFMAKHRGFLNASYTTPKTEKGRFWSFDATLNLVGKQRLPNTSDNPEEFRLSAYSPAFTTLNAQISRNFTPKIRVYLGMDNITSTKQKNPIMDAHHPFSNYFDGGMVYGPVMPGNLYTGLDVTF